MKKLISTPVSVLTVPTGSPSGGGDVAVLSLDINQPSLPTPFYSVLVCISVFMTLSTVFHFINSPDDSPFLALFFRSKFCLLDPFNNVSL